ncbi:DUF427 domain-containing protein [Ekhidna sp.]|uniref:DUF427 domain-containing protein n=1 Tax=Ekhidna sp. TaxID=2608089 RepID=UPI003BAA2A98
MIRKVKPDPGQESVWDYPRPPAIEQYSKHIRIVFNETIILDTNHSFRILETSHPPSYYLPKSSFKKGVLIKTAKTSFCEFKGRAHYYNIVLDNQIVKDAAWGYDSPNHRYGAIKNHICVYAKLMEACFINHERVTPQPGGFYGGWITKNVVGPFKGVPNSWGW